MAIRSLVETVACLHLIHRRGYLAQPDPLRQAYRHSEKLFAKLQAFKNTLSGNQTAQESLELYQINEQTPF